MRASPNFGGETEAVHRSCEWTLLHHLRVAGGDAWRIDLENYH